MCLNKSPISVYYSRLDFSFKKILKDFKSYAILDDLHVLSKLTISEENIIATVTHLEGVSLYLYHLNKKMPSAACLVLKYRMTKVHSGRNKGDA